METNNERPELAGDQKAGQRVADTDLALKREIAYLIERNDRTPEGYGANHCEWLTTSKDTFLSKTVFDWTTDASKAIKFADFDSAVLVNRTLDACYKITEHVWPDGF